MNAIEENAVKHGNLRVMCLVECVPNFLQVSCPEIHFVPVRDFYETPTKLPYGYDMFLVSCRGLNLCIQKSIKLVAAGMVTPDSLARDVRNPESPEVILLSDDNEVVSKLRELKPNLVTGLSTRKLPEFQKEVRPNNSVVEFKKAPTVEFLGVSGKYYATNLVGYVRWLYENNKDITIFEVMKELGYTRHFAYTTIKSARSALSRVKAEKDKPKGWVVGLGFAKSK